ncbi:MAG: hypothetical protein ACOZCE_07390 [Spirochaetota bacterium]
MQKKSNSSRSIFSSLICWWKDFGEKHPGLVQFFVFFMLSNGVTLLQMVLMPLLKRVFDSTSLVELNFQIWQVGTNLDGSPYFIFNYPAGSIAAGGGGGLAYFLAVQITIGIAQIINFFAQRNITFKSNTNIWVAAFWYLVAYLVITIGAAAAQGLYKVPLYSFLIRRLDLGTVGETIADFVTMFINSAISFWVFFPIFKLIFKRKPETEAINCNE